MPISGAHLKVELLITSRSLSETGTGGTFEWVADKNDANPELYAATEGAHVENGIFTFSTIVDRYLFQLDLAAGTYTRSAVPFPFEPGKISCSILLRTFDINILTLLSIYPIRQEQDNLRLLGDVVYLCTNADDTPGDALWQWDDKGASRVFYEVRKITFEKKICFQLSDYKTPILLSLLLFYEDWTQLSCRC